MKSQLFTNEQAYQKYFFLEEFATILDGLSVIQTAIHEYLLKEHVACEPDSGKFTDADFARLAGMSAAVTDKLAAHAFYTIERLDRVENKIDGIDNAEENNSGFKERKAA